MARWNSSRHWQIWWKTRWAWASASAIAWSRRNASYSTQLAHSAVKLIFEAAGGTALYATNPLQEIFRDITAASAHLSLSWHRAAPYYGQIRLGLPVDFDTL